MYKNVYILSDVLRFPKPCFFR